METSVASASAAAAAAAAIPQAQGPSSSDAQAINAPEGVGDAFVGSETAQELEASMKSLHGFSLDLQRLRAIMDKHRKGQIGR